MTKGTPAALSRWQVSSFGRSSAGHTSRECDRLRRTNRTPFSLAAKSPADTPVRMRRHQRRPDAFDRGLSFIKLRQIFASSRDSRFVDAWKRIEIPHAKIAATLTAAHQTLQTSRPETPRHAKTAAPEPRYTAATPTHWPHVRQHRTITRIAEHRRRLVPREQIVVRDSMLAERRGHRADDREMLCDLRRARKMFADFDARNVRGDRPERPAHLQRHVGLEVEHLQMTRSAVEPQENAGLRLGAILEVFSRREGSWAGSARTAKAPYSEAPLRREGLTT